MGVVGSPNAVCRGRLRRLAVLAFLLAGLVLVGSSHAATGRAQGIDVSNWNGSIAWSKVAAAGYAFVFGKATEGTTFVDSTYATNRNGSEAAGLVFGAYHFARPSGGGAGAATRSAIAQADHFLSVAGPEPQELPPVLDLEKTGGLGPKLLRTWTKAWLGEIYARLGVDGFVYSSPAFWKTYLGDTPAVAATGARLWIAHWTSAGNPWVPGQNWDGQGWTFWQWTDCLHVSGISHCTDGDRMNGTTPSSVAIQPYPTGTPVLSTPPSLVGTPEDGKVLAAVPGTWQGGKPLEFTYQWKRCDAAGANCVPLPGATAEWYSPVSDDVGHALTVSVTAASAEGAATSDASPTVAVSPAGTAPSARPENTSPPVVYGTAQAGQTLTSSVGEWSGGPTKFAYRWQRCNSAGTSCVAIPRATQSSYTPTPADIGSTLGLLVTGTGPGGAASARSAQTDVVAAAPLPPVSTGSQTVEQGVAGNVQTTDARATVTWQPGAVPTGLTVSLGTFTGTNSIAGSEVSLTVPDLPPTGFPWPVDVAYAKALPADAVLGYSLDGKVFEAVPALSPPTLPAGTSVGSYLDASGLTHVLTTEPLELALFERGKWGDPTYTSDGGPALDRQTRLRVLFRRRDRSVLVITRLKDDTQARLTVQLRARRHRRIAVLGRGSRVGALLPAGHAYKTVKTERDHPGVVRLRLRLNGRRLASGPYWLRIAAVDPWGRTTILTQRFHYRRPAP